MLKEKMIALGFAVVAMFTLMGCGKDTDKQTLPYDGLNYIQISDITKDGEHPEEVASEYEPLINITETLSVPTYITKVDGLWFIVDCYHDKVIYNTELNPSLYTWHVMCSELSQPHTLASDGQVYLIDDTENNGVLIYEKYDGKFINTQRFQNIGDRPHFSVYDKDTDTFYVWSSESGELYCFRHTPDSTRMYLTSVRKIDALSDVYVRSFSIIDGDIFFVSGVSSTGAAPQILQCGLDTLEVKKAYTVPNELAGMVQITPIEDMFYITVSTDITGNQDYATLIRTSSLDELSEGNYEDIYSKYFIGGGTPYNISQVDDTYYLTEHRLQGHSIWSFKVEDGDITDVTTLY